MANKPKSNSKIGKEDKMHSADISSEKGKNPMENLKVSDSNKRNDSNDLKGVIPQNKKVVSSDSKSSENAANQSQMKVLNKDRKITNEESDYPDIE